MRVRSCEARSRWPDVLHRNPKRRFREKQSRNILYQFSPDPPSEKSDLNWPFYTPQNEQHPDHELWKRDFKGASGLFAIEFHDNVCEKAIDIIADNCQIFGIGSSWGGYSSLLSTMNVSENRNLKSSYVPTGNYLRIYTGSENAEDLISDLKVGFEKL